MEAERRRHSESPVFKLVLCAFGVAVLLILVARLLNARGPAPEPRTEALADTLSPAGDSMLLPPPAFGNPNPEVLSATSIAELPTGWVVLDSRVEQFVLLDSLGVVVRRSGRSGGGPGELSQSAAVAATASAIVVMNVTGDRMDVFELDGTFRARLPIAAEDCASTLLKKLVGTSASVVSLRSCIRFDGRTSALVERIRLDGTRDLVRDEVYQDLRSGTIRPLTLPMIAAIADTVVVGMSPDPCVTFFDDHGVRERRICHPNDQAVILADSLREELRMLIERNSKVAVKVVLPDRYPPFDDLLDVGGALAFHVALAMDQEAVEVVRRGRLIRLAMPRGATAAFGRRTVLLARDEVEGTAFAVVPLP